MPHAKRRTLPVMHPTQTASQFITDVADFLQTNTHIVERLRSKWRLIHRSAYLIGYGEVRTPEESEAVASGIDRALRTRTSTKYQTIATKVDSNN
jgi:hypothetical protein